MLLFFMENIFDVRQDIKFSDPSCLSTSFSFARGLHLICEILHYVVHCGVLNYNIR